MAPMIWSLVSGMSSSCNTGLDFIPPWALRIRLEAVDVRLLAWNVW